MAVAPMGVPVKLELYLAPLLSYYICGSALSSEWALGRAVSFCGSYYSTSYSTVFS